MSSLEDHLNWLNLHNEETIDPERPIIDPHHHFWPGDLHYLLDDLRLDTESGHNIKKTVFIECSQEYLEEGDQDFAPVGETIFVKKICDAAKEESQRTQIEGIVGHVNLLIGAEKTKAVLKSHLREGGALFKGIRHAGGWDHHYELSNSITTLRKIYIQMRRFLRVLMNYATCIYPLKLGNIIIKLIK